MKYLFDDKKTFKSQRISLGVERNTGAFYISCPFTTANRTMDYEKYFSLTLEEYTLFSSDEAAAVAFADTCLKGQMEYRLIHPFDS